jgi:ATP-binding protein involved in chromosome partitioning
MYEHKLGIKDVKHVILVSSGKGGVGKSTVSANVAGALHKIGKKVGILDADIYGPSQAMMFGMETNIPIQIEEDLKTLRPYETSHGLKFMSIATRITNEQSLNWRGTMVTMVLQQLIYQTNWGELDYLVVDMPPGTGDVQIFIADKLKEARALVVTTPQDVSLIDCKKGIDLFVKSKIELLGIVENMNVFVCPCCGHREHIFGSTGGDKLAEEYNTRVLGRVPIVTEIMEHGDSGTPIVLSKDDVISETYLDIAKRIVEEDDAKKSDG